MVVFCGAIKANAQTPSITGSPAAVTFMVARDNWKRHVDEFGCMETPQDIKSNCDFWNRCLLLRNCIAACQAIKAGDPFSTDAKKLENYSNQCTHPAVLRRLSALDNEIVCRVTADKSVSDNDKKTFRHPTPKECLRDFENLGKQGQIVIHPPPTYLPLPTLSPEPSHIVIHPGPTYRRLNEWSKNGLDVVLWSDSLKFSRDSGEKFELPASVLNSLGSYLEKMHPDMQGSDTEIASTPDERWRRSLSSLPDMSDAEAVELGRYIGANDLNSLFKAAGEVVPTLNHSRLNEVKSKAREAGETNPFDFATIVNKEGTVAAVPADALPWMTYGVWINRSQIDRKQLVIQTEDDEYGGLYLQSYNANTGKMKFKTSKDKAGPELFLDLTKIKAFGLDKKVKARTDK